MYQDKIDLNQFNEIIHRLILKHIPQETMEKLYETYFNPQGLERINI